MEQPAQPAQQVQAPGAPGPVQVIFQNAPAVPQQPVYTPQVVDPAGTHGGLAVAGLVLGIVGFALSFIVCLWVLALLCGVTGLVLSIIALATAGKTRRKKSMAVAGMICSILAIIWAPLCAYVLFSSLFSRRGMF